MRSPLGGRMPTAALATLSCLLGLLASVPCFAVQPGFLERFAGTSTGGWTGGAFPTNPGTGGVEGAGDGFLLISRATADKLGAFVDTAPYVGNWSTAGMTAVNLWLNDVNNAQNLEIHFALGADLGTLTPDFWQYNVGFVPPNGRWANFTVDLADSANWTRIIGALPYTFALSNVTKVLLRHDKAPFTQSPDPIAGDFGVDDVLLIAPNAAGVADGRDAGVRPVELAPPVPNPSRGPVAFTLRSWDDGPIRLEVIDASGRRIRQAALPVSAAGFRVWTWDGADDAGRLVAPGAYRVRAVGASGGTSVPLVRVR